MVYNQARPRSSLTPWWGFMLSPNSSTRWCLWGLFQRVYSKTCPKPLLTPWCKPFNLATMCLAQGHAPLPQKDPKRKNGPPPQPPKLGAPFLNIDLNMAPQQQHGPKSLTWPQLDWPQHSCRPKEPAPTPMLMQPLPSAWRPMPGAYNLYWFLTKPLLK